MRIGSEGAGETTPLAARKAPPAITPPGGRAGVTDHLASGLDSRYLGVLEKAQATRTGQTMWWAGRSLAEARNAHSTNTREQFEAAMSGPYNWLEGDIRGEINRPGALEMRHDKIHESGDNLTLREWLALGKASGRGLKLDVKESGRMPEILAAIEAAEVPPGRLMINLGYDAMERWGDEIRRRFPEAILALNPPGGKGKMAPDQVQRLLAQAQRLGGPVTFVVRHDLLTDEAIARFREAGPVSVWNSQFEGEQVRDVARTTRELRERGVDGVIDIRKSKGLGEKLGSYLGWAKNSLRSGWDGARKRLGGWAAAAGTGLGGTVAKARKVLSKLSPF